MFSRALAVLLAGCLTACAGPAVAKGRTAGNEAPVIRWIDDHVAEQIEFIEKTVNINSGTMNLVGVREVGRLYERAFEKLGFETRWVEMPGEMNRAGHLVAARKGGSGLRVLLIGHLDTVFERTSPFQRFERSGDFASGPGTNDMKGGNAVILYALRALEHAGLLADVSVTVVLTGDEEKVGRPTSVARQALLDAVKVSDVALGFEALVDDTNTATIARRSSSSWTLRVEGKQGHSSLIFTEEYGYGAIFETARIVDAFRKNLLGEENLTFSAARVVGGTAISNDKVNARGTASGKTNVIPQVAEVDGDLRVLTQEQLARTEKRMKAIVANSLPGTRATIRFDHRYPPMAPTSGNRALLAKLNEVSKDLGYGPIRPVPPSRRGAADISFAAPHIPSLGGLGTFGTGDHSPDEKMDLRSLPISTKRAALLIYRLSRTSRLE